MDRAAFEVTRGVRATPRTNESSFIITALDVGSAAVRPGCMAEVEEERNLLLVAAKVALNRLQDRKPILMDAIAECALETAIKTAELGKPA